MGERVNGIHEVRGSIPLASIARLGNGASGFGSRRTAVNRIQVTGLRLDFAARGNSSVGRAQPCQGWGRGFESRFPLSMATRGGAVW